MAAAPTIGGRDIVAIGASAGGVEALMRVFAGLPADLPAAVVVVLHVSPSATSALPEILSRAGPLPATHARHGEPIEPGRVYVAPPNHHLLVGDGHLRLSVGPRENRQRPAIDPLFRSAAHAYGRRVVGVVLSGSLDDGTAGLVAIRSRGGAAIVQDPADALFGPMPRSALAAVTADAILPASGIGAELARLVSRPVADDEPPMTRDLDLEARFAEAEPSLLGGEEHPGTPSGLACPECGGSLWELRDAELLRYRCRVGHAFSIGSLQEEQAEQLEEALWIALRNLEEQASLARRLSGNATARGLAQAAARFNDKERNAIRRANLVRGVLLRTSEERPRADGNDAGGPPAHVAAVGGAASAND